MTRPGPWPALTLLAGLLLATAPASPAQQSPAPGSPPAREALERGEVLIQAGKVDEALRAVEEALASLGESEADVLAVADRLRLWGVARYRADDLAGSRRCFVRALLIREERTPVSSQTAALHHHLGILARDSGDGPSARAAFSRALTLIERLEGESLSAATVLVLLGEVAHGQGDLAAAERSYTRALAIRQTHSPDTVSVAELRHALGRVAEAARDWDAAFSHFQGARVLWERLRPDSTDLAATLHHLGMAAARRGDLHAARTDLGRALALRERLLAGSLPLAETLETLAFIHAREDELQLACGMYERALAIREKRQPDSPGVAAILSHLGAVNFSLGNLARAQELFQRNLALREREERESPLVAEALNNLGVVAKELGDLAAARDYHQRSLTLREKVAPDTEEVATSINNLGAVALAAGDLPDARRQFTRALSLIERLAPDSPNHAGALNNLGAVAREEGRLAEALTLYHRSLTIDEKRGRATLNIASTLSNLGYLALERGDLAASLQYNERALAIREAAAPDTLDVSESLHNLGMIAMRRGDLETARTYFRRALPINQRLAPNTHAEADSWSALGGLALDAAELAEAGRCYRRALEIQERIAPRSPAVAFVLSNLGEVLSRQGDMIAAQRLYQRAFDLFARRQPFSQAAADARCNLAWVAWKRKDLRGAERHLRAAHAIAQGMVAEVGGAEARAAAAGESFHSARLLAHVLVAAGKPVAALDIVEEVRGRAFLAAIAEQGLSLAGAPGDLVEAWQRAAQRERVLRAELEAAFDLEDRLEQQAATLKEAGAAASEVEARRAVLARVKKAREQLAVDRLRARDDLAAAWTPLRAALSARLSASESVERARLTLDPGDLCAAFLLGQETSLLFLFGRTGAPEVHRVPLSAAAVSKRVAALTTGLTGVGLRKGALVKDQPGLRRPEAERVAAARQLFRGLFPTRARERLARAQRLVLVPDGALWHLPFAGLVTNAAGKPTYLGHSLPLTYAQSLSAHAAGIRRPRAAGTGGALVVGDPTYDRRPVVAAGSPLDPALTRATRLLSFNGEVPPPLKHARREGELIAALYGVGSASAGEPTEAWLRGRSSTAAILHLATHGWYHPLRPASSGLWLAPPSSAGEVRPDDDGALQAWELPQLRLQAELVVLSACETAAGELLQGEGLAGLARGFQIAGARSVVASQWQVDDASTALLMVAFHRHLRAGRAKDEALRLAMVATSRKHPSPFHWAPFLLVGDPRPLGAR